MKPVVRSLVLTLGLLLLGAAPLAAQEKGAGAPAQKPAAAPPRAPISPVKWGANGYPEVPQGPAARPAFLDRSSTVTPPPAPSVESGASKTAATPLPEASARGPAPALASGMEFGSPLLDIYQRVRAPGAFKALGGRTVWWRLTVYGEQGEIIGRRELTHIADCAFAERDRLEFEDGRVYGRSGPVVFAERQGMSWPTLNDNAEQELALFGMHLRLPWSFADGLSYVVVARNQVARSGEAVSRVVIERRPPGTADVVGPELDPAPRDRFELLYDPVSSEPREFVHRFASSMRTRRVLLEDWREVDGVRMPFRRTYVDESGRQTTTLEILRVEATQVTERHFRLL